MKILGLVALLFTCALYAVPAEAGFRYMPTGAPAADVENAVVEGFADRVPLTVALRQVLPRGMVFSVAEDVDVTTAVSWKGGAPWRDVLNKALRGAGLRANYTDSMVAVERASFALNPPIKLTPPSSAAANEPITLTPPTEGMVGEAANAPMPLMTAPSARVVTQSAPSAAGVIVAGEVTSLDPDAAMAGGDSTVQQLGTTTPSAPLGSNAFVVGDDFNGKAKVKSLYEVTSADPEFKNDAAATAAFAGSTISPLDGSTPLPAPTLAYEEKSDWKAENGQMLRDVLLEWCARVGVDLTWEAEYDYPLQAKIASNGTFEEAVRTLLYGFRSANPQPVGRLHKNDALSQRILIITTRGTTHEG